LDPPIRIEWLEGGEAVDLVEALAVRGLIGKRVRRRTRHAVVIHHPHEGTERLLPDVIDALEDWLADRGRETIEVRVGADRRAIQARELPSTLRARVSDSGTNAEARP
jgi:hypothetical protein